MANKTPVSEHPPYDYVFIKYKRKKGIASYPLCEIVDGLFVRDFVLKVGAKEKVYTKSNLMSIMERELDCGEILDFAIQKGGEAQPASVVTLLGKYGIPQ